MFTAQELEYLKALVETMRGRGYDYYVARTVNESNNLYDFEVVFSDKEITANGLYSYSGCSGVIYRVDSSASVNYSDAKVQVSDFLGLIMCRNVSLCIATLFFKAVRYNRICVS